MRQYHPVTVILYFAAIILLTMLTMHPVFLCLSFLGASGWLYFLKKDKFWRSMGGYLLFALVITVSNPLFSQNGQTVLCFLGDRRITAEALANGAAIAFMLLSVFCWCQCFQKILSTDKVLYLIGNVSPGLGVIFSMTLRFIPAFQQQAKQISQTQKGMGMYREEGWTGRLRSRFAVFSALLTWALEHGVETSDSMQARGYGLRRRTQYSLFFFTRQDVLLLAGGIVCAGVAVWGVFAGAVEFYFYPALFWTPPSALGYSAQIACGICMFLPMITEIVEELRWKFYELSS